MQFNLRAIPEAADLPAVPRGLTGFDLSQDRMRRSAAGFRLDPRRPAMPYRVNADLPPSVRDHLPPHAQDIYRAAFNHAYAAHAADPRQEEAAHRIAWAAVKRSYVKVGNYWEPMER